MTLPRVSVILPNYNHGLFLKQRLDSIFDQSYQDFEVILLDDCSTDQSIEILNEYVKLPKVTHFIINEENSGSPFKQWRKGIELAKGEYVWIAESDDYCDNCFLKEQVSILDKNNDIGLTFCKSEFVNEKGQIIPQQSAEWFDKFDSDKIQNSWHKQKFLERNLLSRCMIPNVSSVLLKRSAINIYSEPLSSFKYYGDWYLYQQVALFHKIYFLNKTLNSFRRTKSSVSVNQTTKHHIRERIFLLKKIKSSKIVSRQKLIPHIIHLYHITFSMQQKQLISFSKAFYFYLAIFKLDDFNVKRMISFAIK